MSKSTARAAIRRRRRQKKFRYYSAILVLLVVCLYPNFWSLNPENQIIGNKPQADVAAPPLATEVPTQPAETQPSQDIKSAAVAITISAAGDVTLGGDPRSESESAFVSTFKKQGKDYGYFLKNVRPIFAADDLTIINFEGTLTTSSDYVKNKQFCFRGDPSYANILKRGSVEMVNLDNNHVMDFKERGYLDTQNNLTAAGIGYSGRGTTAIRVVKGVRIGFCGFSAWDVELSTVKQQIAELKSRCDLVIASFHWGKESKNKANGTQIKYGHAAVDAGADLVLGHHPHVVQGIETYKGKYIAYSLANFCFGGNRNPADKDTFILQQTFLVTPDSVEDGGLMIIPCSISSKKGTNNYQPTPLEGSEAFRVLDRIESYSGQFEEYPKLYS